MNIDQYNGIINDMLESDPNAKKATICFLLKSGVEIRGRKYVLDEGDGIVHVDELDFARVKANNTAMRHAFLLSELAAIRYARP
jgi:hypothetical protein